jgi:hypothetical protein
VTQEEVDQLAAGVGATHVRHDDGTPVAYATRGKLAGPAKASAWSDLTFEGRDETGQLVISIPGDKLVRYEADDVAGSLVVTDDVDPVDSAPSTVTRGLQQPKSDLPADAG